MSGYYNDLTQEEQIAVVSAMAGLRLNAKNGKKVTRQDLNSAFVQATGKQLTQEYMRDPAVVQLMTLLAPSRGETGAFRDKRQETAQQELSATTAITDRNLAARGMPVPTRPATPPPGATRYSASASGGSRFGK
jgi:hypothetical protein